MIGNSLVAYYQELYSSSSPAFPADLEELIEPCVSMEDNAMLCAIPSSSEIFAALCKMNPNKVLGPDGMTPIFFKSCWGIIGADVVAMIQHFFITGILPPEINQTNLVLIPKTAHPVKASKYRPISLCNVL